MRANKPRIVSSVDKIEKSSISILDPLFCKWLTNDTTPAIIEFGGKKISVNNEMKPTGLYLISKDLEGCGLGSSPKSGVEKFEYSRLKKFPGVPFFSELPSAEKNCEEDGIEDMTPEMKQLFDRIASIFNVKGEWIVKIGGITYEYIQSNRNPEIAEISPVRAGQNIAIGPDFFGKNSTVKIVMRGDDIIFASTDEKKVNDFVEKNIIKVREITLS